MSPAKHRKLTPRQEASAVDTSAERLEELAQEPKLARLVAANPNASAELLLELSHSEDKAVRKACTSNANTPVEALLKLGAQFPEQLLENPVFDLLLLAHPELFKDLPTSTLNSLLKRDGVPVELIRWAWKHRGESTLQSLLINPGTPAEIVEELCDSEDPEIRMAAELHCSRPLPEWTSHLKREADLIAEVNATNPSLGDRKYVLLEQLTFSETKKWQNIAATLLDIGSRDLLERFLPLLPVASKVNASMNIQTPTEALALLAKESADEVRWSVARNSQTPAKLLTLLAKDSAASVRMCVAWNSQTPAEVLTLLAKDPVERVRWAADENSQTPAEALTLLAKDPAGSVRMRLARNGQTPAEALTLLAKDSDQGVLWSVAQNSQAPAEALTLLTKDPAGSVRMRVARNSQTPAEVLTLLAKDPVERVRWAAAENSQTPAEALTLLAKDPAEAVRMNVAWNSQTPAKALKLLTKDQSEIVRWGVFGNNQKPAEALTLLAEDQAEDVRQEAAENSQLQPAFLSDICADGCKGTNPSAGRRFLLTLPQCPANVLAKNFRSRSWLERFAIAGNPSTPESLLQRMAQEGNQLVRRAAAENLEARRQRDTGTTSAQNEANQP